MMMTIENISQSISTKECCRPPGLQSDGASNWATEAGGILVKIFYFPTSLIFEAPITTAAGNSKFFDDDDEWV